MKSRYAMLFWTAILATPLVAFSQQSILSNGGMEFGEGPGATDPMIADKWTEFGGPNVERSPTANLVPVGAGHALKAFGDDAHTFAGAYQEVINVVAGQSITGSVWLFSPAGDKLGGTGEAGLVVEFVDNANNTIPGWAFFVYPFNASSPADTWVSAILGPYTAPANTFKVRITCRLKWNPTNIFGAVYWDDARVVVNSVNKVENGDFETAGVGTGQSPMGIDDWMGFNDQEKSDDFAEDGTYSLKLGVREAYSGLYQETVLVQAGDHLYLSGYAYQPSTDPLTGSAAAGLKLEFAATSQAPPAEEALTFDPNDPQDTWVLVTYTTTVPTDVTIARVVMIANDASTTNGPIYMDSASATRNGGGNQLLNPSFESGPGGANGLDNWTEFGGSSCTARRSTFEVPAQQGNATLKISGSCVAGVWQEITVVPGETLTISTYARSKSTDPFNDEDGPLAGVKVEWKLGTLPDPVDIGGPNNTITAASAKDTWIPLYIDYTMPAGTAAIPRFVSLVAKGTALTGHVYFDSCDLVVLNWTAYCYGDLDCDGTIGFGDINPFVLYLSNTSAWQAAYPTCPLANGDINGDGSFPSFGDINPFVSLLSTSPIPSCP